MCALAHRSDLLGGGRFSEQVPTTRTHQHRLPNPTEVDTPSGGVTGVAKKILGIPCSLRKPAVRKAVRSTLERIRLHREEDFRRLQRIVREIRPYDDAEEGDLGIWLEDKRVPDDPSTWHYGVSDTPGILKITEDLPLDRLPSTLAHELGHAATRLEDLWRRGGPIEEWNSELAADWHAYRWGFGREIAKFRKDRAWSHHGPAPGSTFELREDDGVYHYEVTRNFCIKLLKTTSAAETWPLPKS